MALKLKIVPFIGLQENPNRLKIDPTTTINGLLNFDGSVWVKAIDVSVNPDIQGNRTIKWNMILDASLGTNSMTFLSISNASLEDYQETFDGVFLRNWTNGGWQVFADPCSNTSSLNNITVEPPEIYGRAIRCEIKKETQKIIHFKVDDVSLAKISAAPSGSASAQVEIGPSNQGPFSATFWDLEIIDDDTSTLVNYWKGYPQGDTSAAWVDQVADADLEIDNAVGAVPTLRNAKVVSGDPGSVLLIAPATVGPIVPTDYGDFHSIYVLDDNNIWIGGDDSSIFKTSSTFSNFEIQDVSAASGGKSTRNIHFYDSDNGFIITSGVGNSDGVKYTSNGGEDWIQTSGVGSYSFYDSHVFDDSSVIFVGDSWPYESNDLMHSASVIINSFGNTRGISFKDSLIGFRAQTDGSILQSNDGGDTWFTASNTAYSLNCIEALEVDSSWFAIGGGENGYIFQRDTGGWNSRSTLANYTTVKARFKDINTCFVLRNYDLGEGCEIWRSENSGTTWSLWKEYDFDLNDMQIYNNKLYAVGNGGNIVIENV